jgi:hypothetical protein
LVAGPELLYHYNCSGDLFGGTLARADKLLARMRANPRDWRIEDVEALCRAFTSN